MPDRIIRESICTSDTLDNLSWFEEVFWHRLTVNCDDFGRLDARTVVLKSRLFPLKDSLALSDVSRALDRLSAVGLVDLYDYDGRPYLQLRTWEKYQRTRAVKSKYPDRNGCFDNNCCQLTSNVPESECENRESNIERRAAVGERFVKPTVEEIDAYCKERRNSVDPRAFHDFYEAKGWMIGKNKMKDWEAAVRTWEKNSSSQAKKELKELKR